MCNMQELELYKNQIGDAGLSALAEAVGSGALPQLKVLFLHENQNGDVGMQALAGAVSKGALAQCTYISLSDNQIGDVGLTALASACASGALDHLTVCWRPTALSPCLETPHVHSPDSEHLFDVPYAVA